MPTANDAVAQDESHRAVPLGNKWTMMAFQPVFPELCKIVNDERRGHQSLLLHNMT